MSIPVINHIIVNGDSVGTLPVGHCSGRTLIDIWGRNFRVYNPDRTVPSGTSSSGLIVVREPKTVSVKINGVECLMVEVLSSIHIRALTPPSSIRGLASTNFGEGLVNVVLSNLDDNLVVISGETVTKTNGFRYRKAKIDSYNVTDLDRIIKTLIEKIRVEVLAETILTVNTDYDSNTSDALSIPDISKLPSIILVGPDIAENRFYSINENQELGSYIQKKPKTFDLVFGVLGVANNTSILMGILHSFIQFMNMNMNLEMLRDPLNESLGTVAYEFSLSKGGDFKVNSKTSNSNIISFTGSITIKGFDIESFTGFNSDYILNTSTPIDDITLETLEK